MSVAIYYTQNLSINQQKWLRHYKKLCESRKQNGLNKRQLVFYTEKHHITPKCLGGTDDKSNLVLLTPEEHYVAHQLLVKIFPNHAGIIYAAKAMSYLKNVQRCNNKLYGWLRRYIANQPGPMTGKTQSEKTKHKIRNTINERKCEWSKNIYQYDILGNYVNEYKSILDASIFNNNISSSNLIYAALGKFSLCNGYQWSFKKVHNLPPIDIFKRHKIYYSLFYVKIDNHYFTFNEIQQKYNFRDPVGTIKNNCYDNRNTRNWILVYDGFHFLRKNHWGDLRCNNKQIKKAWITNNIIEKWIDIPYIDEYLELGWKLGRKKQK